MGFISCTHKATFVVALLLMPCDAWAWDARVVEVVDGDTITVEPADGGERTRVRLHGIDCPETNQPGGQGARDYVVALVLWKTVDVRRTPQKKDHGRIVAVVILPGGESLQAALLRAGWAWVWPRYCRNCDEWQELQETARAAGRGLWAYPEPVEPWKWRRR